MVILALISLLAGVVLGLRFKVLVVVPASTATLLVAAGIGLGRADSVWTIVLMAAAAVTSLQIGYFGGGIISCYGRGPHQRPSYRPPGTAHRPLDVRRGIGAPSRRGRPFDGSSATPRLCP